MSVVTFDEMINALDQGHRFYVEAAEKTDRDDLKALFHDLAAAKRAMLDDLCCAPVDHAGRRGDGRFAMQLKNTYDRVEAGWDDKDHRYLAALVIGEDRVLHAFGSALVHSDDAAVRGVVRKHLEALIQGHRKLLKLSHGRTV